MAGIALVAVRAAAAECPVSWRPPVGDGFDRPVAQLITFDDGSGPVLFAVGEFTRTGGIPAVGIARWDGSAWGPVGGGLGPGDAYTGGTALPPLATGSFSRASAAYAKAPGALALWPPDVRRTAEALACGSPGNAHFRFGEAGADGDIAPWCADETGLFGTSTEHGNRLHWSADGRTNWELRYTAPGGSIRAVFAVRHLGASRLLAWFGTSDPVPYFSDDHGLTWQRSGGTDGADPVFTCAPYVFNVYQAPHGTIIASTYQNCSLATDNEIWRSEDDGATWKRVALIPAGTVRHCHAVCYHAGTAQWVQDTGDFELAQRHTYVSTDDGRTWADYAPGLSSASGQVCRFRDIGHPTRLLVASDGNLRIGFYDVANWTAGTLFTVTPHHRLQFFWDLVEVDGVWYATGQSHEPAGHHNAAIYVSPDLEHWTVYCRLPSSTHSVAVHFAGFVGGQLHFLCLDDAYAPAHFCLDPAAVAVRTGVALAPAKKNLLPAALSACDTLTGWLTSGDPDLVEVDPDAYVPGAAGSLHVRKSAMAQDQAIGLRHSPITLSSSGQYAAHFWARGRAKHLVGRLWPYGEVLLALRGDDEWAEYWLSAPAIYDLSSSQASGWLTITSPRGVFQSWMHGQQLILRDTGNGCFLPGRYTLTYVNATTVTLDRPCGSGGNAVGGSGFVTADRLQLNVSAEAEPITGVAEFWLGAAEIVALPHAGEWSPGGVPQAREALDHVLTLPPRFTQIWSAELQPCTYDLPADRPVFLRSWVIGAPDDGEYVTLSFDPSDGRFKLASVSGGLASDPPLATTPRWLQRAASARFAVRYDDGELRLTVADGAAPEHAAGTLIRTGPALHGPARLVRTGDWNGERVLTQVLLEDNLIPLVLTDAELAELLARPELPAPEVWGAAVAQFDPDQDGPTPPGLFVAGAFRSAGGTAAANIARWDGTIWSDVGGLSGSACCLAKFADAAGPALYVGGDFLTAGGASAPYLARWDGTTWTAIGDGPNGPVRALVVFDDGCGPALFVGGAFTTAGGQPAGGVARWDGATWESLRGGFDAPVQHLVVFDDDGPGPRPLSLFAGGPFTASGSVPLDHFARWNGSAWEAVPGWSGGWAMAAAAYDADDEGPEPAEWYVAGNFTSAGDQPAAHLARRTSTGWTGLDEGADGPAHALAVFDPDGVGGNPGLLYAAGAFNYVGNQTEEAGHIARWGPALPCLRTQPVTQVVVAGAKTSFSVDVDGTKPFQFQWYHDGLALSDNARISGARGPILTIAGVSATDAGRYNVRVANACGYAVSVSAELAGSGARRGDLNCDGRVDFDDVDPFVLALSAPEQYAVQYPGCGAPAADCNDDGTVSFDDIDAFVRLLGG